MFAAVKKTCRFVIATLSYGLYATSLYLVVTALVFPFVYGPNEIMRSIGAFAVAVPSFIVASYLQLLFTPPRLTILAHHPAIMDDNERRPPRAAQDAMIAEAARAQAERDAQLAFWVNRHRV